MLDFAIVTGPIIVLSEIAAYIGCNPSLSNWHPYRICNFSYTQLRVGLKRGGSIANLLTDL